VRGLGGVKRGLQYFILEREMGREGLKKYDVGGEWRRDGETRKRERRG
jgi:hypothetical protein